MFTPRSVRAMSINPISDINLVRTVSAINGLLGELGRVWVERNLFGFDPVELSQELGVPIEDLLRGTADFEELVFLWEDIESLRGLDGIDNLIRKLRAGIGAENVDLEISVAADLQRLSGVLELEPSVAGGKLADARFKARVDGDWVYVEVTRKHSGLVGEIVSTRGRELAALAAGLWSSTRNFVAILRPMDPTFTDVEYRELLAWMSGRAPGEWFKDYAFVGSVQHGEDESPIVLPHFPGPVSVVQNANGQRNSFGVAYLHVPDLGAENKVGDKSIQAMPGNESLLFIDITQVQGAIEHWDNRVGDLEESQRFSAIVLLRSMLGGQGFTRRCTVVEPGRAAKALSAATRQVLSQFALQRVDWSLS